MNSYSILFNQLRLRLETDYVADSRIASWSLGRERLRNAFEERESGSLEVFLLCHYSLSMIYNNLITPLIMLFIENHPTFEFMSMI